jgi:thiol-disulfide isomerase/thioredoxin
MLIKVSYMVLTVLAVGLSVAIPGRNRMPSLGGATQWLNSTPLSAADLRGKVVLVEFWTYTCINWRRTLPYVRAWAEKYKEQGLVVIGVHTPEFSFEKEVGNVRQAAQEMRIGFPIAMDNDYSVWNAFGNEYWPALYFVDAKGNIRHHQFGEGNYDQSEKIIQQLLAEAGATGLNREITAVIPSGAEVAADLNTLGSPESYLGYEHATNFASPGGTATDQAQGYSAPVRLSLNHWALSGRWTIGREADVLNEDNGRLLYRFHARDVNLVMGPSVPDASIKFRVLIDGKPPGPASGVDVDTGGNGILNEQRTYQLIRQPGSIVERTFEIEFLDKGAVVFDFTFG